MARFFIPLNRLISGEYRRRAAVGGGGGTPVTYLLRTDFSQVPGQPVTFTDGQVLDTDVEGIVDGVMTVGVGTTATALKADTDTLIGDSNNNDIATDLNAVVRQAGTTLLGRIRTATGNAGFTSTSLVWSNSNTAPNSTSNIEHRILISGGDNLRCGSATPIIGDITPDTDYDFSVVLGGYITNGGAASADGSGDFGAHLYAKGGTEYPTWTLVYCRDQAEGGTGSTPLYQHTAIGGTGTDRCRVSQIRTPDPATPAGDLSSQLLPLAMDTFTDTNGVSLDAHTMDVGSGWTIRAGATEIQSNTAQATDVVPDNFAATTTDVGEADVFLEGSTKQGVWCGLVTRYGTGDGQFFMISLAAGSNEIRLHEWNGTGFDLRASTVVTINSGTFYRITTVSDGADITAWVDDAARIAYGAATNNQTSTHHGIIHQSPDSSHQINNFAGYKRAGYIFDV